MRHVRPHSAPLPCPIRPHHFCIQSFHFRTYHHHHSICILDFAFHAPYHVTDWGQSVSKVRTRCGMCIIPGQVTPYFPAICGRPLCVPYASLHFRSSRVCVRAQEIRTLTAVWDVHHPWAGKPLFSGHMRTTPMCSLCIPAFPKVPEYASERRRSGSRPREFQKSSDHFRT